jgi:gliding motility-associated-like protein
LKTYFFIALFLLPFFLSAQSDIEKPIVKEVDSLITPQNPSCDAQVPTAFTPNGDNENDILYVREFKSSDIYFTIYNRWGQEVFHSESLTEGWDGKYKGADLNTGVFVYFLRATCADRTKIERTGNVTLIR